MIKFLIKGLIRDHSRSLFPVLMVSAGTALTVFIYSYLNGVLNDMVDINARFDTGHIKIMTRAYSKLADQIPNDLALLGINDLLKQLAEFKSDIIWVPRIRFSGLIDVPDNKGETRIQNPVIGFGIDLFSPDSKAVNILNLKKSVVRGKFPDQPNEILVSDTFAEKLSVNIGDTVTLIGSTMYGSMSIHNFKVVGTVRFGMIAIDKSTIIIDINDAMNAFDMLDGASEILGFSKDMVYNDELMRKISDEFNKIYSDKQNEFSPIMLSLGEQGNLKEMLQISNIMSFILITIFVFAMSLVLWNAGLMNGIRRYGEIGVRLAMGESKGRIYRSLLIESVCVGIAGSVIGTMVGLIASYYLQYVGFDISKMMQKSTVLISNVIRARVTTTSYYIGFFPGVLASVLGTMFAGIGIYKRQTSQLFKELEV